jgi:NTE family protein
VRGNTGQAVRASSSIPGVFEPVVIGQKHYVDGGIVSPVPVDAARELGADFVIAVDISTVASGTVPGSLLGNVNQSIAIMGRKLGAQQLARADVVIRPKIDDIGPTSFEQRNNAILEGEKAAMAAMPQIRARLAAMQQARIDAATVKARAIAAAKDKAAAEAAERCAREQSRLGSLLGREPVCAANAGASQ